MKLTGLGKTSTQRRTRLTRERVVASGIELADRDGIESISMRRLAQELGVDEERDGPVKPTTSYASAATTTSPGDAIRGRCQRTRLTTGRDLRARVP